MSCIELHSKTSSRQMETEWYMKLATNSSIGEWYSSLLNCSSNLVLGSQTPPPPPLYAVTNASFSGGSVEEEGGGGAHKGLTPTPKQNRRGDNAPPPSPHPSDRMACIAVKFTPDHLLTCQNYIVIGSC